MNICRAHQCVRADVILDLSPLQYINVLDSVLGQPIDKPLNILADRLIIRRAIRIEQEEYAGSKSLEERLGKFFGQFPCSPEILKDHAGGQRSQSQPSPFANDVFVASLNKEYLSTFGQV
jgi:hypothetical protein